MSFQSKLSVRKMLFGLATFAFSAGSLAIAPLTFAQSTTNAAEFMSIKSEAAILYSAPSANAKRLFVGPKGMPVQVLSLVEPFYKVRDMAGDIVWVDRRALSPVRKLVSTSQATIRSTNHPVATIVLQVERGVILEPIGEAQAGWIRVRHAEGAQGFVQVSEVWGL